MSENSNKRGALRSVPACAEKEHREERIIMMDILMIAVLLGCFGLVKLFADFCESQVDPKEK